MHLLTVATQSDGYFPYLQMSCRRHGIELTVLGWGEKWRGWMWRLGLVRKFLGSCKPEDVVCFIDAYDVIMLQPLQVLESRFVAMVPPGVESVVVAHDIAQSSVRETMAVAMFGRCKGLRINAGTYVGRAGVILKMIDYMCSAGACASAKTDDQVLLTGLCRSRPDALIVDTGRQLFLTIANHRRNIDLAAAKISVDGRVLSVAGATPCVLHAPATTRLEGVLQLLGYPVFTERNTSITWLRRALESFLIFVTFATVIILASTHYGAMCACPLPRRRPPARWR